MAKIDMTHVPYRGVAAGAMNDLLAGRLDAMFNTTGSLLQSVRVGQVRALAISSAKRAPNAPEIATFAESGVPGYEVESWYAVFVPARTRPRSSRRCRPTSSGRSTIPPCKRASSRSASRSQAPRRAAGRPHEGGSGAVGSDHQGGEHQGRVRAPDRRRSEQTFQKRRRCKTGAPASLRRLRSQLYLQYKRLDSRRKKAQHRGN